MPVNILVAEDEPVSRRALELNLDRWGFDCKSVADGAEAWERLQEESPPNLIILDWMMPELDGVEVVRRLRENANNFGAYVILLTARGSRSDLVRGLEAGADDYITKPFDPDELRARVHVGVRVLNLRDSMAARVHELETALSRVRRLQGLLPICSYCKKIRDDRNYWRQVEAYISEHSEAAFSHGICPDCYNRVVERQLRGLTVRTEPTQTPGVPSTNPDASNRNEGPHHTAPDPSGAR
ncbi:MAG TPA: response regulator [Terriglobia bacterium]